MHRLRSHTTLHVVACINNPARYNRRFELYRRFAEHMKSSGVHLITVEAAHGDREHAVTEAGNPDHVQLRTSHELWHKENMLNLGIRHLGRLVPDWRYVAIVDADVSFVRPDWAAETLHQLQHFDVVQLWENAIDLGPDHRMNVLQPPHTSFAKVYATRKLPSFAVKGNYEVYPHSGYAWAFTRRWFENVRGLLDFAIVGAADHHMAWGMVGKIEESLPQDLPAVYAQRVREWAERAARATNGNLGFVPGTLLHYFHGKKSSRFYWPRWEIVQRNGFDPDRHLCCDEQGLLALTSEAPAQLRDDLRAYFGMRSEDSIDT